MRGATLGRVFCVVLGGTAGFVFLGTAGIVVSLATSQPQRRGPDEPPFHWIDPTTRAGSMWAVVGASVGALSTLFGTRSKGSAGADLGPEDA